jgi:hypothetical protein
VSLQLQHERAEAERKAWDSLARYKFQMFGYWAAIWVHLNRLIGDRADNPFRDVVKLAGSKRVEKAKQQKEAA